MFEPPAPVSERPRPHAAPEETQDDSWQDRKPVPPAAPAEDAAPAAPAPQRVYTTPPRSFQAVSQHDEAEDTAQRPNRRRRQHAADEVPVAAPLQLVETQAAPESLSLEDSLPKRTKPRRRRSSQLANEPLQIVETQSSVEASGGDNAQT
jgi:hypothetical protein